MSKLTTLLNKNFAELNNEELAELKTLLKENDIDVDTIDEATFETIKNIFKEDDNMNEAVKETAATEEIKLGEKAKEFAEASKAKLEEGFKFVVENVDVAKTEVTKMANMSDKELEVYLKANGKSVLDKIVDAVKEYSGKMKDNADLFPSFNDRAIKSDNIIELIKDVLDEEELTGWGKFKAIVKELIKWLLRLLLKVGAIVLKLAFTIVVGAVKIGATTLVTAGKVIGVVHQEIVKPAVRIGQDAWENHKVRQAEAKANKAEKEAMMDEVEAELFAE